jgi:uncharacterized damage-inducible protein DinB
MTDTLMPPHTRSSAFADLDFEWSNTRRLLQRLPEEHWQWKPHEKSMTLARMATHLVEVLRIAESTVASDHFDLAEEHIHEPATRDELLRLFDERAASLRAAVDAVPSDGWGDTWRLVRGDAVMRSMPRAAALRIAGLNHLLHHRGQLTVYLRLLGVPVPGLYGPSADER